MCSIRKQYELGGYASPKEKWPEIAEYAIDRMTKLEEATIGLVKKFR